MNTFHISWREASENFWTYGANFKAEKLSLAAASFEKQFPCRRIVSIVDINVLSGTPLSDDAAKHSQSIHDLRSNR